MTRTALDVKDHDAPETELRLSDEMRQQLALLKSDPAAAQRPDLKIVTFDSDLEAAVPDPVVMWEKSTCC